MEAQVAKQKGHGCEKNCGECDAPSPRRPGCQRQSFDPGAFGEARKGGAASIENRDRIRSRLKSIAGPKAKAAFDRTAPGCWQIGDQSLGRRRWSTQAQCDSAEEVFRRECPPTCDHLKQDE